MTQLNNLVRIITGNLQIIVYMWWVSQIKTHIVYFRRGRPRVRGAAGGRARGPAGARGPWTSIPCPSHHLTPHLGPQGRPLTPPGVSMTTGPSVDTRLRCGTELGPYWSAEVALRRSRRQLTRVRPPTAPPHRFSLITTRKGGIRGFYRSSR